MEPEVPADPGGDFSMEPEPNKQERESRPTTQETRSTKRPKSIGGHDHLCIPIFAEKDQIIGSQTLSFIKSMKEIPAAGLVEPLKKDALWEAIPAVYQKQGHITVLNLGPCLSIWTNRRKKLDLSEKPLRIQTTSSNCIKN